MEMMIFYVHLRQTTLTGIIVVNVATLTLAVINIDIRKTVLMSVAPVATVETLLASARLVIRVGNASISVMDVILILSFVENVCIQRLGEVSWVFIALKQPVKLIVNTNAPARSMWSQKNLNLLVMIVTFLLVSVM
jgi:hypothetical protein